MSEQPESMTEKRRQPKLGLWIGLGALALVVALFLFGR